MLFFSVKSPIFEKAEVYVNKRKAIQVLDLFTPDVIETQEFNWIKDFSFNKDNEVSKEHNLMDKNNNDVQENNKTSINLNITNFDDNILQNVLLNFNADFNSPAFLAKIEEANIVINFQGKNNKITNENQYQALLTYFSKLKKAVGNNRTGTTHFENVKLKNILKYPKIVKLSKKQEPLFTQNSDSFFIYDNLYVDSTSEEGLYKQFKTFYDDTLKNEYAKVFLIRNHLEICFYTFKEGAKFYPDFILILQSKAGEVKTYQVILEAKGEHLSTNDDSRAKASFLKAFEDLQGLNKKNEPKSKSKNKGITFKNKSPKEIKIIGMDFFIKDDNAYFDSLKKIIKP